MDVYIIAEMAYSHDGQLDKAKEIASAASRAGANALSVHITDVKSYIVPHYGSSPGRVSQGKEDNKIYDYLEKISLSQKDFSILSDHATALGLDLIVMPNDLESLMFSKQLNVSAYVIAPTCMQEFQMIEAIGTLQKPIFMRIGGSTLTEISKVIEILKKCGSSNITLLYGHQDYPTKIHDNNLRRLPVIAQTFGLPIGIADHVDADDEFATILPIMALPYGVTCVEKHLTFDRREKGEDFESALNEDEFALMVQRLKKAVSALGVSDLTEYSSSSAQYRFNTRKRIVAARSINPGEIVSHGMFVVKRSDEGVSPEEVDNIIGLKAIAEIHENSGITYKKLSGIVA